MHALAKSRNSCVVVALLSLAALATSSADTLAKSKGKTRTSLPDRVVAAEIVARSIASPPRFFTINQVLGRRDGVSGKANLIRLASIGPGELRGTLSEAPESLLGLNYGDEPFGVSTFRAPEGLLWTKWRRIESDMLQDAAALAQCRMDRNYCLSPAALPVLRIVEAASARSSGRARFEEVNRSVNGHIRYTSDLMQHGVPDRWTATLATFATGQGDCEDFAIAKYVILQEAGVQVNDLRIILVRDTLVRQAHAVLAARSDGKWYILDNRRSEVFEDHQINHFVPLFALDHQGLKLLAIPYAATHRDSGRVTGLRSQEVGSATDLIEAIGSGITGEEEPTVSSAIE